LNKWYKKLCFPGIKKSTHHFGELGIFLHHSVSKKMRLCRQQLQKKNSFPNIPLLVKNYIHIGWFENPPNLDSAQPLASCFLLLVI